MIIAFCLLALMQDPFFHGAYAEALAKAAEQKHLLMIDLHSEFFPVDQKELWRDPALGERLRARCVVIRLDTDEEPGRDLCKRYSANSIPCQLILDPATQEEVDRIVGESTPTEFLAALDRILGGDSLQARRQRAESHPDDVEAWYRYAMDLEERGNAPQAQPIYAKIIELDPDDQKGKTSLARFHRASYESDETRDLQPLIDFAATYPETLGALEAHRCLAHDRLNSPDPESRKLAIASFEYLLEHGRRQQNLEEYAWLLAGALSPTKESLAKALALAQEAVRTAEHPWAHSTLAQCLLLSGRTEEALASARHAVDVSTGIEKEWCEFVLKRLDRQAVRSAGPAGVDLRDARGK
jgi:tetratricopeptide (TPR) repeat protein